MKDLDKTERPKVGAFANKVRDQLTESLQSRKEALETAVIEQQLASEKST